MNSCPLSSRIEGDVETIARIIAARAIAPRSVMIHLGMPNTVSTVKHCKKVVKRLLAEGRAIECAGMLYCPDRVPQKTQEKNFFDPTVRKWIDPSIKGTWRSNVASQVEKKRQREEREIAWEVFHIASRTVKITGKL